MDLMSKNSRTSKPQDACNVFVLCLASDAPFYCQTIRDVQITVFLPEKYAPNDFWSPFEPSNRTPTLYQHLRKAGTKYRSCSLEEINISSSNPKLFWFVPAALGVLGSDGLHLKHIEPPPDVNQPPTLILSPLLREA